MSFSPKQYINYITPFFYNYKKIDDIIKAYCLSNFVDFSIGINKSMSKIFDLIESKKIKILTEETQIDKDFKDITEVETDVFFEDLVLFFVCSTYEKNNERYIYLQKDYLDDSCNENWFPLYFIESVLYCLHDSTFFNDYSSTFGSLELFELNDSKIMFRRQKFPRILNYSNRKKFEKYFGHLMNEDKNTITTEDILLEDYDISDFTLCKTSLIDYIIESIILYPNDSYERRKQQFIRELLASIQITKNKIKDTLFSDITKQIKLMLFAFAFIDTLSEDSVASDFINEEIHKKINGFSKKFIKALRNEFNKKEVDEK